MAITVPTFAFGRRPTAAELTQLATALNALKNPPRCLLTQTSAATTVGGAGANVLFGWDTESLDTDSMHEGVTHPERITCNTAGKYLIHATVSLAANATGYRNVTLRLNGVTSLQRTTYLAPPAAAAAVWGVTADVQMAVNDYIEVLVAQNSGGNLASVLTAGSNTFSALKVSE